MTKRGGGVIGWKNTRRIFSHGNAEYFLRWSDCLHAKRLELDAEMIRLDEDTTNIGNIPRTHRLYPRRSSHPRVRRGTGNQWRGNYSKEIEYPPNTIQLSKKKGRQKDSKNQSEADKKGALPRIPRSTLHTAAGVMVVLREILRLFSQNFPAIILPTSLQLLLIRTTPSEGWEHGCSIVLTSRQHRLTLMDGGFEVAADKCDKENAAVLFPSLSAYFASIDSFA